MIICALVQPTGTVYVTPATDNYLLKQVDTSLTLTLAAHSRTPDISDCLTPVYNSMTRSVTAYDPWATLGYVTPTESGRIITFSNIAKYKTGKIEGKFEVGWANEAASYSYDFDITVIDCYSEQLSKPATSPTEELYTASLVVEIAFGPFSYPNQSRCVTDRYNIVITDPNGKRLSKTYQTNGEVTTLVTETGNLNDIFTVQISDKKIKFSASTLSEVYKYYGTY